MLPRLGPSQLPPGLSTCQSGPGRKSTSITPSALASRCQGPESWKISPPNDKSWTDLANMDPTQREHDQPRSLSDRRNLTTASK